MQRIAATVQAAQEPAACARESGHDNQRNDFEVRLLPSVATLLCGKRVRNRLRQLCRLSKSQQLVPDTLATMAVKSIDCEARVPPSFATLLRICR